MEDLLKHLHVAVEQQAERLAQQEILTDRMAKDLESLSKKIDNVSETVHRIEVLAAARAAVPLCTAPNLCVELKRQMETLTSTVQTLVNYRSEVRGGARVAVWAASAAGFFVGILMTWGLGLLPFGK